MSLIIENIDAGNVVLDDLGITLIPGEKYDLTQDRALSISTSTDLPAAITGGTIQVLDPLDNVTPLASTDAQTAVAAMNDTHYRIRGGTLDQLDDITLTGSPALASGDLLQFNGTNWNNVPFSNIGVGIDQVVATDGTLNTGTLSFATGTTLELQSTSDFVTNATLRKGPTLGVVNIGESTARFKTGFFESVDVVRIPSTSGPVSLVTSGADGTQNTLGELDNDSTNPSSLATLSNAGSASFVSASSKISSADATLANSTIDVTGVGNLTIAESLSSSSDVTVTNSTIGGAVIGRFAGFNGATVNASATGWGSYLGGFVFSLGAGNTVQMTSSGNGAFCQGSIFTFTPGSSDVLSSTGLGSFAQGNIGGGSTISATADGSYVQGNATSGGLLQASSSASGGFCQGEAAGAGSQLNADSPGVLVHGRAINGGVIHAGNNSATTGEGALAVGFADGTTIEATGRNSFQFGPGINNTANSLQVGSTIQLEAATGNIGFTTLTPATVPNITGSRTDGTALANLLTALVGLGLITDSTTA